ncbi:MULTISPECIES: ABC transporter permease [Leuconostoc]|uniref:Spermidine/putrescine ABC transporter permease PotC n=1 Tax=Leuconostoc pseudomesenteroides TaxID=33968 RepID=A0A1X0VE13_LEUPS|nr:MULTISPECIES: ABC transporter permease [Leuconostoc]KDA47783.1 Spermidine Putrescine ABC transporter permease component potC [Leuconostoc pseudomesenteroides 1159]KDA50425.1 Spermidine Putrescine ABC transporter permease component potC [Leuconostoc pseudomesenteroides PS12]CCJ66008.1 Spermidine Putrescine ABC transporter permease component potC (TC_3.A.1.11.1) [Leuconostoc pseudomesenteroides 4882]MCT4419925.1 ABC transporter permease [Leuconostoc falkenbergense]MDG9744436.1 ABC transporter
MKKAFKWSNLYLWFVFILLYLPIFFLIIYSFNAGDVMQGWDGFSLKHYVELFADTRIIEIVVNTFLIALLSSLLASILGTAGALYIYDQRNRLIKNIFLSLNNILLVSPDVIIGASFLILFTVVGFSLGFASVLLSHIAFSIPIVVLMVLPRLQEMNQSLVAAAKDLGANNWQMLSRVILPVISPGILAGFFMAFTYSLDDFAVTFFVTGNGFSTLSVEIYSRARQGVSLEINALSAMMFIVSLVLVLLYYVISTRSSKNKKRGTRLVTPATEGL